ncbi:hypothetical protein Q3G72_034520 [Acer saccharum]|nr:hypothetical protein Q3G72_034520 [Acer saccharum]
MVKLLNSVQGCVQEITTSFLSHQVQLLGTACCKALNEVDDKFCWPKVLNNYCAAVVSGRGASPTPTSPAKVLEN